MCVCVCNCSEIQGSVSWHRPPPIRPGQRLWEREAGETAVPQAILAQDERTCWKRGNQLETEPLGMAWHGMLLPQPHPHEPIFQVRMVLGGRLWGVVCSQASRNIFFHVKVKPHSPVQ